MFDKPKVSEKEFSFFKILIFRLVELASEPEKISESRSLVQKFAKRSGITKKNHS